MKKKYTEESTKSFIEDLKKITPDVAKVAFFSNGYRASSFEMPEYYIPNSLDKITLQPIDWTTPTMPKITQSLVFLTPKGFLGWRSFSLLHPYIYIHIVNEITKPDSWEKLVEILTTETLVYCYSTPEFISNKDFVTKKQAIDRWVLMAEKDLVKDCVDYSFLTVTDIKNFYPSIYTHSIAWAVDGKDVIRNARRDYSLLGNRLDKLFQNARDGQTNGIPIGSMVSDFIAEIILKRVDVLLSDRIEAEGLSGHVIVTRYRDDYRFLSKTEEGGKKILRELGKILNEEYNLMLNEEKTSIFNDVLEGAVRNWSNEINDDFLLRQVKYEEMGKEVSFSYIKDILFKTYKIQRKYPNGRPSITILSKLISHLDKKDVSFEIDESGAHTLISILRKLSLVREEVSAQMFMLLDILFKRLSRPVIELLISELLETIKGEKDYDYQIIWLYRLCLAHQPDMCGNIDLDSSPLLKILSEEYTTGKQASIEIYPTIDKLDVADIEELKKFSLIDPGILTAAPNKAIDKRVMLLFSYRKK